MKVCKKCKNFLEVKPDIGRIKLLCKSNPSLDFVTGEPIYHNCYKVNTDGKCKLYKGV